ncbi:hypothetical protein SKAU_G00284100 [Synaphobranchus kaupii]|uniref:Uncharacterized protein n=1 Tax=Synaphobranchus kaupii TaxID=118154 RepID=A0A9Q1EXW8_SYNKA|nr:hypothetical protein SKAU_G00284100 [Synaphobranchus kaupii]
MVHRKVTVCLSARVCERPRTLITPTGAGTRRECARFRECTMKVQEGKFKLLDLLVVSMQRVLKYHLLLKQVKLEEYGRPKIDGELKVSSIVNRTKQDSMLLYVTVWLGKPLLFISDGSMFHVHACKRKGYSYELKEITELQSYNMSDDPMNTQDMKKWSYGFYLIHLQGKQGFQFF